MIYKYGNLRLFFSFYECFTWLIDRVTPVYSLVVLPLVFILGLQCLHRPFCSCFDFLLLPLSRTTLEFSEWIRLKHFEDTGTFQCMLGYFVFLIIHRTVTWNRGSAFLCYSLALVLFNFLFIINYIVLILCSPPVVECCPNCWDSHSIMKKDVNLWLWDWVYVIYLYACIHTVVHTFCTHRIFILTIKYCNGVEW